MKLLYVKGVLNKPINLFLTYIVKVVILKEIGFAKLVWKILAKMVNKFVFYVR